MGERIVKAQNGQFAPIKLTVGSSFTRGLCNCYAYSQPAVCMKRHTTSLHYKCMILRQQSQHACVDVHKRLFGFTKWNMLVQQN